MVFEPIHFIGEPVSVEHDEPPLLEKKPGCPNRFVWEGKTYSVTELLSEWHDYTRRGHMALNMTDVHLAVASRRGSWGVGKIYFRVRTDGGQIFDLYYDRAPRGSVDRKGSWFLFRELKETEDNDTRPPDPLE